MPEFSGRLMSVFNGRASASGGGKLPVERCHDLSLLLQRREWQCDSSQNNLGESLLTNRTGHPLFQISQYCRLPEEVVNPFGENFRAGPKHVKFGRTEAERAN
jgi:hypothetical protein